MEMLCSLLSLPCSTTLPHPLVHPSPPANRERGSYTAKTPPHHDAPTSEGAEQQTRHEQRDQNSTVLALPAEHVGTFCCHTHLPSLAVVIVTIHTVWIAPQLCAYRSTCIHRR